MNKNEIYEFKIDDLGSEGEGIGHVVDKASGKSMAVFVKDAIIDDVISARIIKVKKNYAYGRLEKIIQSSPLREEALCQKSRSCGGCSLMHMKYEAQLEYKWNKVKGCLERIGGVSDAGVFMEPILGMEKPFNFRNKMQFPVGVNKDGRVMIGFFAGRTHSIIDLSECAIGHPVNNYILKEMKQWLQNKYDSRKNFIYNEELHKGLVRHILTRVGFVTGELMVCLIINGTSLAAKEADNRQLTEELLEALRRAVQSYNADLCKDMKHEIVLQSVSLNFNTEKTNRILGDRCKTIFGSDTISDYIGENKFAISPLSFYQVNPVQTKVLYDKALSYANLSGDETVWDMYCGIGTISLALARKAKKVYGVEIVPQAIEDAKNNARENKLANTEFFCGKAEEVVPRWQSDNPDEKIDVVVVDPPRKGCDEKLLDTIKLMAPRKLVYVSCDPATLARDVGLLAGFGYQMERCAVVDQFCHSGHVETVVLMSKVNTPKG